MKRLSLVSAAAFAGAALLATTAAEARPRGIVAAGVIGGLAVGTAIAAATIPPARVYVANKRVRTVRVVPAYALRPVHYRYGCVSSVYWGC